MKSADLKRFVQYGPTRGSTGFWVTLMVAQLVLGAVLGAYSESAPEKLDLWSGPAPVGDGTFVETSASITVHHPVKANGTAIVICPGGGYGGLVMEGEGHGIARWLNQHGIVGVVLQYRLPQGKPFAPLLDAQRAIRLVRSLAEDWGCDPDRIGIVGFSAGGHLASTAATHFDGGETQSIDRIDRASSRPDFAILVYPVITMGPKTHVGSKRRLLGDSPREEWVTLFSNELQVTDRTPPCFLAHALDDHVVPPEHSELFYQALLDHGVAAKYLLLPSGDHGLNGYKGPMWDAWQTQSLDWLKELRLMP